MAIRYCNVDLSGGTADGTSEASAYEDFSTAVAATVAGDTLYVKKAAAREDDGGITISNNGSKTACITIEGYGTVPGDGVRFEYGDYFEVAGDYVVLKNIDIEMSRASAAGIIRADATSEKLIIHNCRFYNTNTGSVTTLRVNTTCVATDCEFIGDMDITKHTGMGVVDLNSFDGLIMSGCVIRGRVGIDLRPFFHGVIIEGCLFYDAPNMAMERGINLDMQSGTSQTQEVAILNNTIHCSGAGIHVHENLDGGENSHVLLRGNVIYGSGSSGGTGGIICGESDSTVGPAICFNATGNLGVDGGHGITGWGTALGAYGNIELSEDPFVDKTNADFRLNGVSGAGAACRAGLGFGSSGVDSANFVAGPSGGLTASNRRDIGAYGHSGLIERISVS